MLQSLDNIALLLVFMPLVAAAIVGLTTRFIGDRPAQVITCTLVCLSALFSYYIFHQVIFHSQSIHIKLLNWFSTGTFVANWTIFVDSLTAVMFLVVTTVSALVHVYSVGYMGHDEFKPRFMSYLSLFTFCMLMLVSADNFAQLFFGWEGVGLCSYLLIGFWFKKPTANAAAIKAFLVNRVGDFGFALGIFLLYWTFGSIEYETVFESVATYKDQFVPFFGTEVNVITMICLLLFMGAMGKSAQIGLHTWLPDAMEGPTPVSALIHAATMVTAGVFMVARCSHLFEYSEVALGVVTLVGAVTALFAASIALVQNDIKRIIAYSTCSQLGYMFFACGVSAYSAGIFHLTTHAFFKALLFLGAGSVIHALSDEQDIRKMGGLWKKIPFTYGVMWIGSLALAGIYPFAGYFSKDIILEAAYASDTLCGHVAYWMGLCAALFTAFYSWRLIILTFHGNPRASQEVMDHVHESPLNMTIPLFLLAAGSIISGYIGYHYFGMVEYESPFWSGVLHTLSQHNALDAIHHVPEWVTLSPLIAGLSGILIAYTMYMFKPTLPQFVYSKTQKLYNILLNKWYFDEFYDLILVRFSKRLGRFCWRKADMVFIDGMPNGMASLSALMARAVSIVQSGFIYHYAFVMLFGLLCILSWALLLMK